MILIPTMRLREVQMNIFRELRKKKGLTQIELAKMVNVQQTTVSKWEVGRAVPDYPVLLKLAELYGVSVDYLLGREAITPEEYASGMRETKKMSITPIEEDMLEVFRKIGEKDGEEMQRLLISMAEGMLKG